MNARLLHQFLLRCLLAGLLAWSQGAWAQADPISGGAHRRPPGRWINLDSVAKPIVVKAGKPKVAPAHPNVHVAGAPTKVPIPKELIVITPGENGVPQPETIKAEIETVPALHPEPVPALPPQRSEEAAYDVSWLDNNHGLSSNRTTQALEDSRGHIWIGTMSDGVNRYDGSGFVRYAEEEGLDNYVYSILEDSRGHLWFGSCGGKIIRYDGRSFTHFSIRSENSTCFVQIHEDRRGNIWFGSLSQGLIRYDGAHFTQYTEKHGLCSNNVQAIEEDRQGNLWVGTSKGLCRFDGVSFTQYTEKEGLPWRLILSLQEDSHGRLWIGTSRGASCYDGDSFTNYSVKEGLNHYYIRHIMEDSRGNLWFGTLRNGASRFDGKQFTWFTQKEGLNNNAVNTMMEDSGGNLWLSGHCISRLNTRSFRRFPETEEFKIGQVFSICESRHGELWFGTSGGIIRYDGDTLFQFGREEGLGLSGTHALLEDRQGHFWIGGTGGGVRFDGEHFIHYGKAQGLIDGLVWSILEGPEGDIWFGTDSNGAIRYDGRGFTHFTEKDGLGADQVMCMLEAPQGGLLFGTYGGGVSCYDGKAFNPYPKKGSFEKAGVLSLFEESSGALWFGIERTGAYRYDGNTATVYNQEDGLAQNTVRTILEDSRHNLWLGTHKGIDLMVPVDKGSPLGNLTRDGRFQCYAFGKEDGLNRIENDVEATFLDRLNHIWWGSGNGPIMLDLNQFELPSEPPRIMLGHIRIEQKYIDFQRLSDTAYQHTLSFGKALSKTFDSITPFFNYPTTMRLPHFINNLSFHFSGIDWAAPHKIKYSYFLDGLDKEWSDPGEENKVEYRNLPFGSFTFKVRAIGAAQAWSEPFEYRFTILPPWYRSWWAYGLWAALLSGSLFAFYRFQLTRQLAQAETRRLQELDAVKTRLYTNITHEFRTPLTIIQGIAGQLMSKVDYSVREELKRIQRNGQQLLNLVNQMLDLAKLESGSLPVNKKQGDVLPFLKYLLESFHSLAEVKGISLHFQSEEEKLVMDYDAEKMRQIVGNLLSNAVKFTGEGGRVKLEVGIRKLEVGSDRREPRTDEGGRGRKFTRPRHLPGCNSRHGEDGSEGPMDWLQLSVSDTGAGIPEEKLPHIFSRFYQADDSATRRGEGTGIGLTLTRELVKLLGGEIEVESELGKGAAFTVFLPITKLADTLKEDSHPAPPGPLKGEIHPPLAEKLDHLIAAGLMEKASQKANTLLIIEDNPDVTHYLSSILEKNYALLTAPNGRAGLETAQQEMPSLILCDVMMPEMDGYEVCRRLKGDLHTSHIPIILLTAKADTDSRIEGIEQGADAYLAKPFEERELKARLKKLLENRERLRQYYTSNGFIARKAQPPAGEGRPSPADRQFFEQLLASVEDNLDDPAFSAEQLSQLLFISYPTCLRKVKAVTGKTVKEYVRHIRICRAVRLLLEEPGRNIGAIAEEMGFHSNTHFTREFRKAMGCTPTEYRRG